MSAFNLNPLLAMSGADMFVQAVITVIAISLYHLWVSGCKPVAPSVVPQETTQPVAAAPVVQAVSNAPVSAPAPVPAVVQPVVAKTADSAPAEIAAVIAAAVAMVLDRPHRVVSVQFIGVVESRFNVWAHEGRQRIFDSHKFR